MNPAPTPPPDSLSVTSAKLWLQAACIFAGAVAFGVIYNGVSPLGVRPTAPSITPAGIAAGGISPVAIAAGVAPGNPVLARPGFFNQTIAMTLEGAAGNFPLPGAATPAPVVAPAAAVAVAPTEVPKLAWPQVQALLAAHKIVLVDARTKAAFDLGHIPGAVLLPSNAPLPELQAFAAQYPKDTALVIYCSSTACGASQHLTQQLAAVGGYTNVSEMPGGFAEYTVAQATPAAPKP